jgi:hypothetical protein
MLNTKKLKPTNLYVSFHQQRTHVETYFCKKILRGDALPQTQLCRIDEKNKEEKLIFD